MDQEDHGHHGAGCWTSSTVVLFLHFADDGNLQEWSRRVNDASGVGGTRRKVVYGSTELISAEKFVGGELKRLGQEG